MLEVGRAAVFCMRRFVLILLIGLSALATAPAPADDPVSFGRRALEETLAARGLLDVGWGGNLHALRAKLLHTFPNIRQSPVEIIHQSAEEIREAIVTPGLNPPILI